ncbi:MAG TPA: hypothetical protein EYQ21_00840 [Flavobacteriales bacterium]|jgi:hypothetical protein|nr:hypothetical protein [Flavobacteriales bacterium]
MKTLTFNENNHSPYIFANDKSVTVESNRIIVGESSDPDFYIGDMHSGNATLHTDVTPPDDWQGNRYTYNGSAWAEISGWVDPKVAEIARLQAQIDALNA